MIIDSHVHIFPPEVVADRRSHLDDGPAFAIIYADPRARMVTAEELIAALDADGVDKAVVCGFPWRDAGRARVHNDYILAATERFPDRLVPTAGVDPLSPGAMAEAERALSNGAAGLGEIALYDTDLAEPEALSALTRLGRLCADADKPLLLHTNEPVGHSYSGKSPMTLAGLYKLLRACPETRFQLAHLGGGLFFFGLLKKEVGEVLANAVFDTAAAPFLYRPELYTVFADLMGPEKLVYGSDYPLLSLARYLKDLETAGVENELKARILGRNAAEFWRVGE